MIGRGSGLGWTHPPPRAFHRRALAAWLAGLSGPLMAVGCIVPYRGRICKTDNSGLTEKVTVYSGGTDLAWAPLADGPSGLPYGATKAAGDSRNEDHGTTLSAPRIQKNPLAIVAAIASGKSSVNSPSKLSAAVSKASSDRRVNGFGGCLPAFCQSISTTPGYCVMTSWASLRKVSVVTGSGWKG